VSGDGGPRIAPVPRGVWIALLAANVVLRLWLATLPGYANDVDSYKRWGLGAARAGLAASYETTHVDYPPLFLYVLWSVGKVYLAIDPDVDPQALPEGPLLTTLVKLPHVAADLLLACLLYGLVGSVGSWGKSRAGPGFGRLAALLYLWNPAVLWGSGYWGQPDGLHSLLATAALGALALRRMASSGVLLSLGGLMKPLAAPLVPLLATVAGLRGGWRGFVRAGLGGLLAAVAAFLPFLLTGRIGPVLRKVLLDVEAMPFTSVNAHNLWWILGTWRDANAPIAGAFTPKTVGLTLFLAAYAMLLVRALPWIRSRNPDDGDYAARLALTGAAITAAFFFLSTHMHENHLFMAVPLLIVAAGRSRRLLWLTGLCSVAVFTNMALHDLVLPHAIPLIGRPSPVIDPHLGTPFAWVQLVGSFLDALLVGWVTASCFVATWRLTDDAWD
jgi:hypothetical protein